MKFLACNEQNLMAHTFHAGANEDSCKNIALLKTCADLVSNLVVSHTIPASCLFWFLLQIVNAKLQQRKSNQWRESPAEEKKKSALRLYCKEASMSGRNLPSHQPHFPPDFPAPTSSASANTAAVRLLSSWLDSSPRFLKHNGWLCQTFVKAISLPSTATVDFWFLLLSNRIAKRWSRIRKIVGR